MSLDHKAENNAVIFTHHSEVIAKIEFEKLCSKFEHASGAKVPPECDTMMTIGSLCISSVFPVKGKPIVGMDNSCPNNPSNLLLLTVLICNLGKHLLKSAAAMHGMKM